MYNHNRNDLLWCENHQTVVSSRKAPGDAGHVSQPDGNSRVAHQFTACHSSFVFTTMTSVNRHKRPEATALVLTLRNSIHSQDTVSPWNFSTPFFCLFFCSLCPKMGKVKNNKRSVYVCFCLQVLNKFRAAESIQEVCSWNDAGSVGENIAWKCWRWKRIKIIKKIKKNKSGFFLHFGVYLQTALFSPLQIHSFPYQPNIYTMWT